MNLFFIVASCITFAIIIASQSITEEFDIETHKICLAQENATEEDLVNIINGTLPETRSEKCLSACLAESYGTVSVSELIVSVNLFCFDTNALSKLRLLTIHYLASDTTSLSSPKSAIILKS